MGVTRKQDSSILNLSKRMLLVNFKVKLYVSEINTSSIH